MRLFVLLFALVAGLTALVSSMPNANLAIDTTKSSNLVPRHAPVDVKIDMRSADPEDDDLPLLKRDALSLVDLLKMVLDSMNSGTLDFNLVAQQSVKFLSTSTATLDLNALAKGLWRGLSTLLRSASGAPGNALLSVASAILKPLVRNLDLNAIIQTMMSMLGKFIGILDFNAAIKATIQLMLAVS